MKIAWVTDTTAVIDDYLQNHPDVYIAPITILLDEEEYTEGVNLTPEELHAKLKTVKTAPKTSQPSIGTFQQLFESLSDYDAVIAVHISSKLSGTVSSCEQAAQLVDIPVHIVDSLNLAYPLTWLLKKGISLAENGESPENIKTALETIRSANELYVLIGSLEQLHRSGRMSGLQFFLGSILKVTPIISLENGALSIKEKVRSEKKAKEKILNYFKATITDQNIKEVFILYGLYSEPAEAWKEELSGQFPEIAFSCQPLGAAIGLHAGEHTLGISWFNEGE